MRRKHMRLSDGFTLVELILYIALITIFIGGAIQFAWDIIYGRVKSHTQQEVSQNLRLATKRIAFEIRNASAINSVTATTLSLANSDSTRNPTIFDVTGGRLRIGYGSAGFCPTTVPCTLTSNEVSVSNLTFTNLSSGITSFHIRFSLTVTSNAARSEWQNTEAATMSAELRSN